MNWRKLESSLKKPYSGELGVINGAQLAAMRQKKKGGEWMTFELFSEGRFGRLKRSLEAQGYKYMGPEYLTRTMLGKDCRFQDVPVQTVEDIRNRYLQLPQVEEVRIEDGFSSEKWIFVKFKEHAG